jgi:hypothetical protein
MTIEIELGKQYRTRDGREVRIYSLDGSGDFPVHGAIYRNGFWELACWTKYGSWSAASNNNNIIEVRPRIKREIWVNVYGDGTSVSHSCQQNAAVSRGNLCIACVRLVFDYEEGDGL